MSTTPLTREELVRDFEATVFQYARLRSEGENNEANALSPRLHALRDELYARLSELQAKVAELEREQIHTSEWQSTAEQLRAELEQLRKQHSAGAQNERSTERAGQWIAVSERLPKDGDEVLVCHVLGDRGGSPRGYDVATLTRSDPETWVFPWDRSGNNPPPQWVTHWMPLPPPPDARDALNSARAQNETDSPSEAREELEEARKRILAEMFGPDWEPERPMPFAEALDEYVHDNRRREQWFEDFRARGEDKDLESQVTHGCICGFERVGEKIKWNIKPECEYHAKAFRYPNNHGIPWNCPTYWDGCNCKERLAKAESALSRVREETIDLREALADLVNQINKFAEREGEADFYTGKAIRALSIKPTE